MDLEKLYDNLPGPPDTVMIIDDDEINRANLVQMFSDTYMRREAVNIGGGLHERQRER